MSTPNPDRIFNLVQFEGPDAAAKADRLTAVAQELGGVTLTPLAGADAEWFGLPLAEAQRQRRLDTHLADALGSVDLPGRTAAIASKLARVTVTTVRDVLVLGPRRTGGWAGLTQRQNEAFSLGIRAFCPDEPLLEGLMPTDIAGFCWRLDQVHAGALARYLFTYAHDPRRYHYVRLTVANLLGDEPHLPEGCKLREGVDLPRLRETARRFAAEFLVAQSQPEAGPSIERARVEQREQRMGEGLHDQESGAE